MHKPAVNRSPETYFFYSVVRFEYSKVFGLEDQDVIEIMR